MIINTSTKDVRNIVETISSEFIEMTEILDEIKNYKVTVTYSSSESIRIKFQENKDYLKFNEWLQKKLKQRMI